MGSSHEQREDEDERGRSAEVDSQDKGNSERVPSVRIIEEYGISILTIVLDEFLVLQSQVYALEGPGKRTLAAFRRWFSPAVQGKVIPVLGGRDKDLLDDRKDLVALAPMDEDRLNRFLQDYFGWFFRVCDQSPDKTIENLWKTDDRPHGL